MPQIQVMKVKICLVGEGAVGKTSLTRRFVYDEFDDRYITTLGAKVSKKDIMVREQDGSRVKVKMTVWDIMGQKSFLDIMKEAFFFGAQGVLAVCDVTRRETLSDLHDWVASVHKVTGEIPIHFLANKVDLKDQITFDKSELAEVAAEYDSPYAYTSARTGENVQEAFDNLAKMIVG
ncbi:MAG: Rab family GTPase [candidate division NC10 bacterium]